MNFGFSAHSYSLARYLARSVSAGLGLSMVLAACADPDAHPSTGAPDDIGKQAPFPASSSKDLAATLDEVVAAGVAPGVGLTVSHPSYAMWSRASGVGNTTSGDPLKASDRFRAGSMLKVAVATAVLQLVERDQLSLEATLDTLVAPAIAKRIPRADAISVRMLLAHTSGIPDFSDESFHADVLKDPAHVWTFDELLDRALAQPPVHAPGASYSYTNTGYILLGKILEETTGETWRDTLRKRVFARAKLTHTELPEEGHVQCDGCSRGYGMIGNTLTDITEVDPSMAGAAGGDALITTTEDLTTLMRALTAGKLFDQPTTLDRMLDFAPAPIPEEAQIESGLGIARFQAGDLQLIGHLGSAAGYQGFVFFHPGTGIVASGYMNRTGNLGAFVLPVLDAIARVK
jgi:D-alanyl-D-alanine carboxypeptidase